MEALYNKVFQECRSESLSRHGWIALRDLLSVW